MSEDLMNDADIVRGLFEGIAPQLGNPEIAKYLTVEQMRNVLVAVDVRAIKLNETTARFSWLYVNFDINTSDEDPGMSISIDPIKLKSFTDETKESNK